MLHIPESSVQEAIKQPLQIRELLVRDILKQHADVMLGDSWSGLPQRAMSKWRFCSNSVTSVVHQ